MLWVYLSPHFDDAAFSCGGLIWDQVQAGHAVQIWTICSGEPPLNDLSLLAQSLHERWKIRGSPVMHRHREDQASLDILHASGQYLSVPDCIYRKSYQAGIPLYDSIESIFREINKEDVPYITKVTEYLNQFFPYEATLVSPLAIGGHVDHQLTRRAAEKTGLQLWYYPDFPYVIEYKQQYQSLVEKGWNDTRFKISQSGLQAWQDSIAAHRSQISSFWESEVMMRQQVMAYYTENGMRLWRSA